MQCICVNRLKDRYDSREFRSFNYRIAYVQVNSGSVDHTQSSNYAHYGLVRQSCTELDSNENRCSSAFCFIYFYVFVSWSRVIG